MILLKSIKHYNENNNKAMKTILIVQQRNDYNDTIDLHFFSFHSNKYLSLHPIRFLGTKLPQICRFFNAFHPYKELIFFKNVDYRQYRIVKKAYHEKCNSINHFNVSPTTNLNIKPKIN